MKLGVGAEDKKKVWALGTLMVVAAYLLYSNASDSSSPSRPAPRAATETSPLPATTTVAPAQSTQPRPLLTNRPKNDEFHPVLRPRGRQGEQTVEPGSVDPTIHLELL